MRPRNLYKIVGVSCCLMGGVLGSTYHSYGAGVDTSINTLVDNVETELIRFSVKDNRVREYTSEPDRVYSSKEDVIVKDDGKGLVLEYTYTNLEQGQEQYEDKRMELEHPFPKLALNQLIQELDKQGKKTDDIYKLVLKRGEGDTTTHFNYINLDYDVYHAWGGGAGYEISYVGNDSVTLYSTFENITEIESYIPEQEAISEYDNARGKRFFDKIKVIHHYAIEREVDGGYDGWFQNMTSLEKIGIVEFIEKDADTKYSILNNLFQGCTKLNDISKFKLPEGVKDVSSMFQGCISLQSIEGFSLPKSVTEASSMFQGCTSLTKVPNIFHKDSEIEDAQWMFQGCTSITDLSEFKLPTKIGGYYDSGGAVWNGAYRMFADCTALTKVPNIFEHCESMVNGSCMFQGCTSITDLSEFTLPTNIRDVSVMFDKCENLTHLPNIFSNFNKENYVASNEGLNVEKMFRDCTNLKTLEEGFTLPKEIVDATGMFENTSIYELPEGFRVLTGNKKIGFLFLDPMDTDPEYSIYVDENGNKWKKIKLPTKVDRSFIEYVSANIDWHYETPGVIYYQTHKVVCDSEEIKEIYRQINKTIEETELVPWLSKDDRLLSLDDTMEFWVSQPMSCSETFCSMANMKNTIKYIERPSEALESLGYANLGFKILDSKSNTISPIITNMRTFGILAESIATQNQNEQIYDLWNTYYSLRAEFDIIDYSEYPINPGYERNWDSKEIHLFADYTMRTIDINVTSTNAPIKNENNKDNIYLDREWLNNNKSNPELNFNIEVKSPEHRQKWGRPIRELKRTGDLNQEPTIMENKDYYKFEEYEFSHNEFYNFSNTDTIAINENIKSGIYKVTYSAVEKYFPYVRERDEEVEEETSKDLYITIDFTPPTGSITKGTDGKYIITASDDFSGIDKIVLPNGDEITGEQLVDGKYTIDTVQDGAKCIIYDKAGNTKEVTYSSEVSTSEPTLDVTVSDNYTSGNWINKEWLENNRNNSNVTITVTATDEQNGIKEVTKTVNGGQPERVTNTSTEHNKFIGNDVIRIEESTPSGSFKYEYKAENPNGASSDPKDVIINIDVKPPTGSITKGTDGKYVITASDDFSGIDKIVLPNGDEITREQLVDGKYTLDTVQDGAKCIIYDKAGNKTEVTYSSNTVISKPTLEVKTDGYVENTWTNTNVSVSLIAKDENNAVVSIEKTDNSGGNSNISVNKGSNPNEYIGNDTIDVSQVTESGSYTYTYVAVNDKGERSEPQTITVNIDIKPPTFKITENSNSGYTLTATDDASGVAKIVCSDGKVIEGKDIANGTYDVSSVTEGTYHIYDNAGNVRAYFYTPSSEAVSGSAISLGYNPNWTNQNVKVDIMIENADDISLIKLPNGSTTLLTDIEDKVELDGNINFHYMIEEEGNKEYLFVAYRKTRDNGKELPALAHIKIDKTAPVCEIVERDGKKYLTVTDNLSGVHHVVSPSGKLITWSSTYVDNGLEVTENGTYTAYDNASNSGTIVASSSGGSEEGEGENGNTGETVIPPTPIPPIPDEETQPEGNQKPDEKDPEGNKKPDEKDPEGNKKPDGKDPEGNKKPDEKEPEGNKKPDGKDPEGNKKPDGKDPKGNKKPDGKDPEENKKPDSNKPDGIWIDAITPDGDKITIFIPKDKIYLLESEHYISGKDLGYPFIDRVYFINKNRPIIIGLNGEHYHYVKAVYKNGGIEKVLVASTMQLVNSYNNGYVEVEESDIVPKTGDNIQRNVCFAAISGFVAFILNRRKKKLKK